MTDLTADVTTATIHHRGVMDRLADVIVPPLSTLGLRGTIVTPLVVVLFVSLVSAAALNIWAASAPSDSGAALMRSAGGLVWVLAAAAPLAAMVKGALYAIVVWAVLVLMGGTPAFRALFSALLYGEAILSAQALWISAAVLFFDLPAPGPGQALPVATGLDAWVTSGNAVVQALVQNVTPFYVVWVVFLGLAFSVHGRLPRWKGVATAFLMWALTAGLAVLRVSTAS